MNTKIQNKKEIDIATTKISQRQKVKALVQEVEKLYGPGSILNLKDPTVQNVDAISTGSYLLDESLGIGGFPKGRIVEIYGPEASGKTTIALKTLIEAQKKGQKIVFIDVEHALDLHYFESLGGKLDDSIVISQPGSGEEALQTLILSAESGAFDLIVLDSVAALVPRVEIEGKMGDQHIGLQSRLMSQSLRKIAPAARKTNTCVIFINQIRMKIGGYGNPETTSGGVALKFYSSIRLEVRRSGWLYGSDNKSIIGHTIRCKVLKNKMACPYQQAEVDLIYGNTQLGQIKDFIKYALKHEKIKTGGGYYKFLDKSVRGENTLIKKLQEDDSLKEKILAQDE